MIVEKANKMTYNQMMYTYQAITIDKDCKAGDIIKNRDGIDMIVLEIGGKSYKKRDMVAAVPLDYVSVCYSYMDLSSYGLVNTGIKNEDGFKWIRSTDKL